MIEPSLPKFACSGCSSCFFFFFNCSTLWPQRPTNVGLMWNRGPFVVWWNIFILWKWCLSAATKCVWEKLETQLSSVSLLLLQVNRNHRHCWQRKMYINQQLIIFKVSKTTFRSGQLKYCVHTYKYDAKAVFLFLSIFPQTLQHWFMVKSC